MKIFSASQIRAWDKYTIAHEPISSLDLMKRASVFFTDWFINKIPDSNEKIIIFCGSGIPSGICFRDQHY